MLEQKGQRLMDARRGDGVVILQHRQARMYLARQIVEEERQHTLKW